MDRTRLTVELVEALQTLLRKGKPVDQIVQGLQTATLPGIIEYGCLRFDKGDHVPPLPKSIIDSALCRALGEVRSELGVRADGPPKTAIKNLTARPIEFHVVWTESDLEDLQWEGFCVRFESAVKQVGFSNDAAMNLHSALFEMAANAVIHSKTPVPALCGYQVEDSAAVFTVADVGVGVLASLRSAPKYSYLTQDVDAIQLALQTGVTSRQNENGGLGFNSVFKALTEQWGKLRFRSQNGSITMDGTHLHADQSRRSFPPPLPGFQVSICCRMGLPSPTRVYF